MARRPPIDPRLWRYARSARRYLALSVGLSVLTTIAIVVAAVMIGRVLAGVITDPGARDIGRWSVELSVLALAVGARVVVTWAQARVAHRAGASVVAELEQSVLEAGAQLPPRELESRRTELAVIVGTGLSGLRGYLVGYLPALILAVLVPPVVLAVIAVHDPTSGIIVVITLPLIPIFMILIGLLTEGRARATLDATTRLSDQLLDLFAGMPTLRALGRESGAPAAAASSSEPGASSRTMAGRVQELGDDLRRRTMSALRIAFLSSMVLEMLATLSVALIAVSIGLRLVFGEMSLYAGIVALVLAPEVYLPLRTVGERFHAAQDGMAAADKAFAVLEPPGADSDSSDSRLRNDSATGPDLAEPGRSSPGAAHSASPAIGGSGGRRCGDSGLGGGERSSAIRLHDASEHDSREQDVREYDSDGGGHVGRKYDGGERDSRGDLGRAQDGGGHGARVRNGREQDRSGGAGGESVAESGRGGDQADRMVRRGVEVGVVGGRTHLPAAGRIELCDLAVRAREGMAPDGLSAVLRPGAVSVLTGPNGSGKSTVLQAVLGLIVPDRGVVAVDGIDVAALDPAQWWARVAWLPQRPVLVPGTLRENLELLGARVAEPTRAGAARVLDELEAACTATGFDTVLNELPDRWDTRVGAGGAGLSLGQRQRLALTRVLAADRPILLLDEPTAHLDAETEATVLAVLTARARAGATVVIIAHRPPLLAIADNVIEVSATRRAAEVSP
ncbi:ATP-binding cassette domain-containing protein [Nocardia cyriacigeorgica]|uniref:ATP-binding cassette domain-containing protein n=1 Tax=Nocardia cyriacigeorgica TaxID=135487 RepID=UPI00245381FD|nr:ATP-binding cassette domain-containing protein [Nocardia cyriacigeorgica]